MEPIEGGELKGGHPVQVVVYRDFENHFEIEEIPEEYDTLKGVEQCDTVQGMFEAGEYLRVLCPDNC